MNQKEWKTSGKFPGKYKWYNQTRKFQRSLCYESDPNANIIHHLRDTEEQRNYNDTHYEYWGFNEDGTFEYGKYVVFWTKEHHDSYHAESEETRKKISEANKGRFAGEKHPMYGKHLTDEAKEKISKSMIAYCNSNNVIEHRKEVATNLWQSEDYRNNWRAALHYKTDPEYIERQSNATQKMWQDELYRRKLIDSIREWSNSDSVKQKRSENAKALWQNNEYREKHSRLTREANQRFSLMYKEYKQNGGTLNWNEFRKSVSKHNK